MISFDTVYCGIKEKHFCERKDYCAMGKTFVIGIAGATQSGKSTFAKKLEESLHGVILKTFHIDDYHKPKAKQPIAKAPITQIEYTDFNSLVSFDLPHLRRDIKAALDEENFSVIIIEGTMILYDEEILNLLDLKLFVDSRADERAIRYIELYSQYHDPDFIKNSYLDLVRYRMDEYIEPTKWRADIIINGSMESDRAVEVVKTYIANVLTGTQNATHEV